MATLTAVLRDGNYMHTDLVFPGDILVPPCPSPEHTWDTALGTWVLRLSGYKKQCLERIYREYEDAISSGVPCQAGEMTYHMDAGEEHATRLDGGIRLAEMLGQTVIPLTDFYNVDHPGVPLTEAREVLKQQGAHYALNRALRNLKRSAVQSAKTKDEVDAAMALTLADLG